MGSKNNEPSIRFKGSTDAWEQRKLGDILKYEQPTKYIVESTDYNDSFSTPVLTAGQSFILGYTDETNGIKNSNENSPVIIFDDFTTSSHYVDFPFKVKSSAMKLLTLKSEGEDFYFIYNVLKNIKYLPQSHERHWISKFSEFTISVPVFDEQKKIGTFFKNIDNLITLHQRKLDNLEILKKTFLDKLFPKYKEVIPLLRFSGFYDDWEKCKLSNILTEFSIKSQQENQYVVLSSTNNGMEYREGRVSSNSNIGYKIIDIGHLVVSPQNLWLGNININYLEKGLVSPSYKTFKFIYNNQDFINPQLRLPRMLHEYKASSTQGASIVRRNLDIELFLDIKIKIPNIYEQTRIGLLFRELDNNIVLHQQKLKHLENLKKYFLNNLFI